MIDQIGGWTTAVINTLTELATTYPLHEWMNKITEPTSLGVIRSFLLLDMFKYFPDANFFTGSKY